MTVIITATTSIPSQMEPTTAGVRLLVLTLPLLMLLHLASGAITLMFIYEPVDLVVEPGKSARLDCHARLETSVGEHLQEQPVISWRSDDGQPISFIGDKYRSQLENGSLYISFVNQESIGNYQCIAYVENIGAIASRTAFLKLASLPGFDREPQDTMVYPGQIAYLSCKLTTIEKVNIQWFKNEQPFVLDESRMTILPSGALEIDEVFSQDVGSYRCNASGFGQYRLSNQAQLTLQASDLEGESTPVFVAKPVNQIAIEKSTITLECAANGNPKPNVYWLKDGTSLDLASLDSRYQIVAASSLMIKDLMEGDNGSYQCRAKNDIDTLDAVAEVIVQVPPRFTKRPKDKEASERQDLELECEIYGKPIPTITWLKNGEKIKLSNYWQLINGYNLRINGLLNIDAGIFQCIGKNPAGSVQASARLTIHQPKKEHRVTGVRKASGLMSGPKLISKKRLPHRLLSNSTWQHPSTLLGHTSSAYTPNPPLSISPSDDPADFLDGAFAHLPGRDDASYDILPHEPAVSDAVESLEGLGEIDSLPSAPRNLSIGLVNSRFVALRWQEPELVPSSDVSNYLVYYRQEGFERERIEKTPEKEMTVTISGLQPGTTYLFRVVANISNVLSASSKVLQLTTEPEPNVPSQPLNLIGWPTSSESIALTWEEPTVINGRILYYFVTYAEGDNEETKKNTTKMSLELLGLLPYKEYNIWVQAVNDNGPGASTGEIRVRTYGSAPTSPPNVTAEAASSTSVIIRWEPPIEGQNGIITGYKIRYRPTDRRSHPIVITTEGNQRMHVLSRLEKNVSYQVRVCAFNVNGTGPCSEWLDIETYANDSSENEVPSAPTNLRTKAMSDSISVWWGPPKDQSIKIRGYVLTWGKGIPDEYKKVLDGKQRYYLIDNLEPNSDYVITLRAKNEAGEGLQVYENVKTIERSTPESAAPLTPPVGLKAIVLSFSTVVLYWTDTTLSKNQYVTDNRYYIVRYTLYHSVSNQRYKYYNASDLNCMIHDLKPNTEYEFTVKVVKGRRESPWSMVVLNKTMEVKPASSPRDLTVQSIDNYPKSVLLRWLPPKQSNGEINGYIISYTTDNTKNERDWKAEAVVGDKTEYVLSTELEPSTTYYFKIQARNTKGYGPFSVTVSYKTLENGRGLSYMLIYLIVGCSILVLTGISVVFVFVCCRRSSDSSDSKKGYLKDSNIKTNIKPPDLWIHHDQMELKALEKTLGNGEVLNSTVTSNTLPRSNNSEYNQDNAHGNSSSLDKRTYIPSYMDKSEDKCSTLNRQHIRGNHKPKLITLPVDSAPMHQPIATATPIINNSMSQQTIHSSCSDVPSIRQNYPRTVAQYNLSRAHITLESTPESNLDSCNLTSTYEPLQTQLYSSGGPKSYNATSQYAQSSYGESIQSTNGCTTNSESNGGAKRLQGHPLKSFSVPAPPPQSAPSTPAQQKHGVSQVTVRPTISGSPYKKATNSNQLIKNRLASVTNTNHTPEEIERLKPSYSTEELNQEMANLEGLMKDLNAITASEFEC